MSNANIKYTYYYNWDYSGVFTFTTFDSGVCNPTNVKILGDYMFNCKFIRTYLYVLGITKNAEQSSFTNININLTAAVKLGHFSYWGAISRLNSIATSVRNITLFGSVYSSDIRANRYNS